MQPMTRLVLSSAVLAAAAMRLHAASTVQVEYRVFPGLHLMDGNWAALLAASDGKVYAGLAYHGGDGHLAVYDSKSGKMLDAGNLTDLSGEAGLGIGPQSKIHSK